MTSTAPLWTIRVCVLGAFAATLWFAGPRAADVLAARFGPDAQKSPPVTLDHVAFAESPSWLTPPMLVEVSSALSPWLSDEVPILDEPTSRRLRDGLASVAWVRDVRIARLFPNQFRLHLELRRPLLAVHDADDRPLCLVDRDAVVLPFVANDLPKLRLYREGGLPNMDVREGAVASDRRVLVGARIAVEWREQLAPLVEACPRLLEIDATNLDEQWVRGPEYPEVRVHLARADASPVVFAYGRPVRSELPRVPVTAKASVLRNVLAKHPALEGLVAGDLRFERRWSDYLQPRPAGTADPFGPWRDLPPVVGGR
ncbi:MAG: hypothetical protein AB8H80_12015 [Planctomycetota bacterium]